MKDAYFGLGKIDEQRDVSFFHIKGCNHISLEGTSWEEMDLTKEDSMLMSARHSKNEQQKYKSIGSPQLANNTELEALASFFNTTHTQIPHAHADDLASSLPEKAEGIKEENHF